MNKNNHSAGQKKQTDRSSSAQGSGWQLLIKKERLSHSKVENCDAQQRPLAKGQVLMKVKRVAFTTNNITYALLGESMSYWRFFPGRDESWGILPTWGFAEVEQSHHDQIKVGDKFYGYWPLATHLIVEPSNISTRGFIDKTLHRRELPEIYNQYQREATDRGRESQNFYALLKPLFTTSYLIDDFLEENSFFNAQAVVLSSASSKTAFATAFLLKRHRDNRANYKIVGLTSTANVQFTKQLNIYDVVLTYEDLNSLEREKSLCYVDFSGNTELRSRIHKLCADRLRYSSIIGATHWQNMTTREHLSDPTPRIFFAPSQFQERAKILGIAELQQRIANAWNEFMTLAKCLNVIESNAQDSAQATYTALLEGNYNPKDAYIFVF